MLYAIKIKTNRLDKMKIPYFTLFTMYSTIFLLIFLPLLLQKFLFVSITCRLRFSGKKSAFTVTHPVAGLDTNTLKFTKVITNIGQHYSTQTGQFTCEYPGIYVFSLNVLMEYGTAYVHCDIRQNNVQVVRATANPEGESENGFYSGSTSAVIHMAYGDIADVYCESGVSSIHVRASNPFNSFSGVLIKAY